MSNKLNSKAIFILKPHNSDWVLNPQAGTRITVFSLKWHTWSQNLLKFGFFMSQPGKNSVRDKAIV